MKKLGVTLFALLLTSTTAGAGGGGNYCILFDNFCDSIEVTGDSFGLWDWTCDGFTLASGDLVTLTQSARAYLCLNDTCPFGPGAADDWSFVFRGGANGTFNLFNLSQGVQFQFNSPHTAIPGGCAFAGERAGPSLLGGQF